MLAEIRKLLPGENIIYFADTANCPYGPKPAAEIRRLSEQAVGFLIANGAKLVVVACNTASSAALAALRATFPIPFVGMVPAVKPAALTTRTGRVGVIATQATIQAQLFADLVGQHANGAEVITMACPGLVALVEAGEVQSPVVEDLLHCYLDDMLRQGIDTLVLGCTHYPFLRPTIERIVGPAVAVIDSGEAVARQVKRVLEEQGLVAGQESGRVTYFASGEWAPFSRTLSKLGFTPGGGRPPL